MSIAMKLGTALVIAIGLGGIAHADTTTTKSFGNWKVECVEKDADKSKFCIMSQTLVNAKTKQRVFSFVLNKNKAGELMANIQVPLGGDLASGLSLAVDDSKPVKVAYKRCVQFGCLAEFKLSDDWNRFLGNGKAFIVTLSGDGDQTVPFSIELKNFSDAITYFKSQL